MNKLIYYIIFKLSNIYENYSPVVNCRNFNGQTIHALDNELVPILKGYEFILSLPRSVGDILSFTASAIIKNGFNRNNSHDIRIFPDTMLVELKKELENNQPTLIIFANECQEVVNDLMKFKTPILGYIKISELHLIDIQEQWVKIGENLTTEKYKLEDMSIPNIKNIPEKNNLILPLLYFYNQCGITNKLNDIKVGDSKKLYNLMYEIYAHIKTCDYLEGLGDYKLDDEYELVMNYKKQNCRSLEFPTVISAPGIAKYQFKYMDSNKKITKNEEKVIQLMGLHYAIGKKGIYLEGKLLPNQIFLELDKLEQHCKKSTRYNNDYVIRAFKKIGKLIAKYLGEANVEILKRSSSITVFSDFPIGLAILPGDNEPIGLAKPIIYKPLTPLARTLTLESRNNGEDYYIGKGRYIKILIAECVPDTAENKMIRKIGKVTWDHLKELSEKYENIEIIYKDIDSLADFKQQVKNDNFDILILSAHGIYDKENSNQTGLEIGRDIWHATENDFRLPPVVILSACHVSPRGAGVVTVADLLLRFGVIAVLGTFIPVDVRRNSLLIGRLMTYIIEAQQCCSEDKSRETLIDLWRFITATNAIYEILESSKKLKTWYYTSRKDGTIPHNEFIFEKSRNNLQYGRIYKDTINLLRDLAERDKKEYMVDSVISSNGYFQESIFYQWIGRPENIIVKDYEIRSIIKSRNLNY